MEWKKRISPDLEKSKLNYLEIGFHFDSIDKISATVKRDIIVNALETFKIVFGAYALSSAMHDFFYKKISR